jgi:F0F1-type ATP synthase epsilon subunit
MPNLKLEIVAPTGFLFQGECVLVVVPSAAGDVGIMHGHEAIAASLRKESQIAIYDEKQNLLKTFEAKNGGFANMQDADLLTILVD